jgi:hypothetical protein
MARTCAAGLLTAQAAGYPTGGIKPAITCVFTQGATTYNYSFDPTSTTNRMLALEHRESYSDIICQESATIVLRNDDKAVPDLTGYYVDLKYGANTSGGLVYSTESCARLWVISQQEVSKSKYIGGEAGLYVYLKLHGSWDVMNETICNFGNDAPAYQDDFLMDDSGYLRDLTVYQCLEWLIETHLSTNTTGLSWSLDASPSPDDGILNTFIPWPSTLGENDFPFVNANFESQYDTVGDLIKRLMKMTHCYLRPTAGLHFEIVYPQDSDTANEEYYSTSSSGHPFYENSEVKALSRPNWFTAYSSLVYGEDGYITDYTVGHARSDDYTGANYNGTYMKVYSPSVQGGLLTDGECQQMAEAFLAKSRANSMAGRTVVPHDARVELFDKINIHDERI